MPSYKLGKRSKQRIAKIHPHLQKVVKRAIKNTEIDFTVLEGLRTKKRQRALVAAGASKTMNSRHLTGHAVDLGAYVDGSVRWDWPLNHKLAKSVKAAATAEGIPIEWGGDWRSFKDGPHWQLPWDKYPA